MRFSDPLWLGLLISLVGLFWARRRWFRPLTIKLSTASLLKQLQPKRTFILSRIVPTLRWVILILAIFTLARPQGVQFERQVQSEGIDILIALDTSKSMSAEDFKPNNRLELAKQTIRTFINDRPNDRIGLVVFGKDAYTQCPLTLDHQIVQNLLDDISIDMAGQGTAIGLAIATSLNRLKTSTSESKILILVTDGENNAGQIAPLTAAQLAQKIGVKIYTIGIGTEGGAPIPINDPVYGKIYSQLITKIDEPTLKQIAQITSGAYYRAKSSQSLESIYQTINKLETSKIEDKKYTEYTEFFNILCWLIFGLMCLELCIKQLVLVRIPE